MARSRCLLQGSVQAGDNWMKLFNASFSVSFSMIKERYSLFLYKPQRLPISDEGFVMLTFTTAGLAFWPLLAGLAYLAPQRPSLRRMALPSSGEETLSYQDEDGINFRTKLLNGLKKNITALNII